MPKNNWLTNNKTDEEVKKEIQEQESTNYLRKAPQSLQRVIRRRFMAGIILFVISAVLMLSKFPVDMIISPIIIGIVAIFSSMKIRNVAINGTYKTFKGKVVDYDYTTPLKRQIKSIIFVSEDKRYKITYHARKLKIGDIVTVYSPSSVLVYEQNGCYNINGYYVADIKKSSYSD